MSNKLSRRSFLRSLGITTLGLGFGIINKPGTYSFAGHPDSILLYEGLKKTGYLQ
ncbi:MAG TPA: hypothetical protein DEQ06_06145 [Porphyromonadaceae bacterium]|nr:hypothetical protein [Clostridiales bacterium]HCC86157.1 hypothetical protein [Porphyromonadaceae bacterium]